MVVSVTGVLGVLVNAKLNGIVPAVKPLLDRLQTETAFFVWCSHAKKY